MLPFGEVKKDIKRGYSYLTYDAIWAGGTVNVILERYNEKVIFDFSQWNLSKNGNTDDTDDYRILVFDICDFIAMPYKELVERANYCLFY